MGVVKYCPGMVERNGTERNGTEQNGTEIIPVTSVTMNLLQCIVAINELNETNFLHFYSKEKRKKLVSFNSLIATMHCSKFIVTDVTGIIYVPFCSVLFRSVPFRSIP
jgi:hypothetical protein